MPDTSESQSSAAPTANTLTPSSDLEWQSSHKKGIQSYTAHSNIRFILSERKFKGARSPPEGEPTWSHFEVRIFDHPLPWENTRKKLTATFDTQWSDNGDIVRTYEGSKGDKVSTLDLDAIRRDHDMLRAAAWHRKKASSADVAYDFVYPEGRMLALMFSSRPTVPPDGLAQPKGSPAV